MNHRIYQRFVNGELDEEGLLLALDRFRSKRRKYQAKIRQKLPHLFSFSVGTYTRHQ